MEFPNTLIRMAKMNPALKILCAISCTDDIIMNLQYRE